MAMPTDPDPWNWSVDEVQIAFQPAAVARLTSDLPYAKLPPLTEFLEVLRDNDVAGATLLTAVDDSFLRGDCGIKSLGVRSTVLHCIGKLRDHSRQIRAQNEPTGFGTPISVNQPMLLDEPEAPQTTLRTPENAEETLRTGEQYVEDRGGRKRRRLNLIADQAVDATTTKSRDNLELDILESVQPGSYLPLCKHAVDDFFFGSTATGEELVALAPSHPLSSQGPAGEDRKELAYANTSVRHGTSDYADKQLRRFLAGNEEQSTSRRGRDALVTYPYRDGLQAAPSGNDASKSTAQHAYTRTGRLVYEGSRSAIVIQPSLSPKKAEDPDEEEAYVAIRETDVLLSSSAIDLGYSVDQVSGLIGDSEHLLTKWCPSANEDSVVDSDDEGSSDDNRTASVDDSGPRGEDEAEDEDEVSMPVNETKDIIATTIEGYAQDWREKKLPRLEAKEAWTVWRKTKESKTIRDAFIDSSHTTIEQLEHRLSKQRADMEKSNWDSREALLKQCESMQATVEDKEAQLWRISVWQRRHRPKNPNSRKLARKSAAKSKFEERAIGLQHVLRTIGSDDRMSLSPGLEPELEPSTVFAADNSAAVRVDEDRFFTPENFPSPHGREDTFVLPGDEADESDQASEDGSTARDSGPDLDGDTAMPDREATRSGPHFEQNSSLGHPSTPAATSDNVKLERPKSSQVRKAGDLNRPSPSALNKKGGSLVVDLTLDSSSPTPKKKSKAIKKELSSIGTRSTRAPRMASETLVAIENATVADVDSWDYDQLRDRCDRRRILVKLLRDAGLKFLNDVRSCFQKWLRPKFIKQLSAAVKLLSGQALSSGELESFSQDVMLKCARIAYAFHLSNPEVIEMEVLSKQVIENAPKEQDLAGFFHQLRELWDKKDSKLFVNHKPVSSADPFCISSGSDDDPNASIVEIDSIKPESSAKKHKRKVVKSQAAENSRTAARERAERFTDIQTQRSNPSQLQEMVLSETSSGIEINVARDDEHDPIYIHPSLASRMKPHQIEGVQFMWREITAADERGNAQGCLLAHTMGLGKTLQSIALMLTVDEVSRSKKESVYTQLPKSLRLGTKRNLRHLRFLVICPSGLLQNWRKEINQWSPRGAFGGHMLTIETTSIRPGCQSYLDILNDWSAYGGILLIGYAIFRNLLGPIDTDEVPHARELADRVLRRESELVVTDEAHAMKNIKSATAIAASKLVTESRIALTGTPMSNDVHEIYALVSWVAPRYLGEPREFSGRFTIPIREGLYRESTAYEKRVSMKKLAVLHKEIEPKINRADITVLRGSLKPKTEFVIMVELTEVQHIAYSRFVEALIGNGRNCEASQVTIFAWLAMLSLLTNHPYCYRQKLLTPVPKGKKKKTASGEESEVLELPDLSLVGVANPMSKGSDADGSDSGSPEEIPDIDIDEQNLFALGFTEPMVQSLVQNLKEDLDPVLSAKARIFGRILQLSQQCGDKTLVFSSSIPTLNYLGRIIQNHGMTCARIDGSVEMKKRTALVQDFERGKFDVFLISTRAGGQGLNLPAANRVVIYDFSFNPSWEQQAIGRAYRLGQAKPVFVYRFVAGGTFETNIYNKQLFKTSLASRVVDKKNPGRHALRNVREYLYEPQPVAQHDITEWLGKDPKVLDKIINEQTSRPEKDKSINICHINTMETLQQEDLGEKLTALEMQEVQEEVAMGPASRQSRRAINGLLNGSMGIPGISAVESIGIPSTAPYGLGNAAAALRFAANQFALSTARLSSHAHGPPRDINQHFAARDIRFGSQVGGMGTPLSATQPSTRARNIGGLPFVRSLSPQPPDPSR